jgi:hypothetical protein
MATFDPYRNLAQYNELWDFLETLGRRLGWRNPILRDCAKKVSFMIDITLCSIVPRDTQTPASEPAPAPEPTPAPEPAPEPEPAPPAISESDPAPPSYRNCNLEDSDWDSSIPLAMRQAEVEVHDSIIAAMERPISSFPPQVQQRLLSWAALRDKVVAVIAIQGVYAHVYLEQMKSLLEFAIEIERTRQMPSVRQSVAYHLSSNSQVFSRSQSHHGSRGFSRSQSHHGSRGFSRSQHRSPADVNHNWRAPLPEFTTR